MKQRTFDFDAPAKPLAVPPRDPSVDPIEAPRLSRQCVEILARLRMGMATNRELATIALKYTSRISDLRDAGFTIVVVDRYKETGHVLYELKEEETRRQNAATGGVTTGDRSPRPS
jgi:hypothetical protein